MQLNPGATLNHKYSGEVAVRSSGLPYVIIRPTGMSDDAAAAGPALLEASQGDRITGKVARSEIAALVAAAAGLPAAVDKTFEVRRSEAADAQGCSMGDVDTLRLFLGVVPDRYRAKIGLGPFPAPAPPPPPPSDDRKAEILADPRVKSAQARNAGGRVRTEEESSSASSVRAVDDGRAEASAPGAGGAAAPAVVVAASENDKGVEAESGNNKDSVPENVVEVREWIRRWRAKTLERQLPQGSAALK